MKIYRAIGTFLSSILTFVLIFALVVSLLVLSAAHSISKNTISDITKTILSNEDVKNEISAGLSDALSSVMQNTIIKPSQGGASSQMPSQSGNASQTPEQGGTSSSEYARSTGRHQRYCFRLCDGDY